MRVGLLFPLVSLVLLCMPAHAQTVVEGTRSVATDSTEAWAMRYFAGTTLMTSFGETVRLAPWKWSVALDLGGIPPLSESQRQVGFGGSKEEDLNRSPVIGRLRVALGLPDDWVAELGYTPPLEIDGSRARNIVAMAIGRRLLDHDNFTLSMRAVGQVGKIEGDITCPRRLAGVTDRLQNRFGCQLPSNDTFTTNYYGLDATAGWSADAWTGYASAGIARANLAVQVDAPLFTSIDRSRLTSNSNLPWFTIGAHYDFKPQWSLAAEVLYVPLEVRRPPDFSSSHDSLISVRMQLRFATD